MNKIQVLGGGFPATSKTWRFIRDMINEVHEVAVSLGGDNCIVKGCEDQNGEAAAGVIIIAGEALPFIGGAVQSHVEIVESVTQVEYFQDAEGDGQADVQDAYFERYARFAASGTPWADLKRISPLSEISTRLPPKQSALPFWGAVNDIPDGWQLCDGSNGTPDLRGMFIAGYDPNETAQNAVGKTGGSHKHSLTEAELPAHKHTGGVNTYHKHEFKDRYYIESRGDIGIDGSERIYRAQAGGGDTDYDNDYLLYKNSMTEAAGGYTNFTTNNTGGGNPHENRPKFYTMAWIAYVG